MGSGVDLIEGRAWLWYGLQLTGVTSSGVPFLELIQPVPVR
jgi:hypothetical protein